MESPNTVVAPPVDTKEKSNKLERVQDLNTLQRILPFVMHSPRLYDYVLKMFRDPDTLILWLLEYEKSLLVASVIDHLFFGGKVCILVWAQNPDHYPVRTAM